MTSARSLRGGRTGAVLVCLVGLAMLLPGPSGDAATLTATGWWWRPQQGLGGLQVPAPPDVPEGGLLVEGTPDEANAIAAVRFQLTDTEIRPVLTLQVESAVGAENVNLAACPAGSNWTPVDGGDWRDHPTAACQEGSVGGFAADGGSAWTFPLSPLTNLFEPGTIDVVIVPGSIPGTEGAVTSTFRITFAPPTASSLATQQGEAPQTPAPERTPFVPFATSPPQETSGRADSSDVGGTITAPQPTSEPAQAFSPGLTEEEQAVQPDAPLANRPQAAELPWQRRWAAVAILVLGAGTWLWLSMQPDHKPRRLGPFGGRETTDEEAAEPRGIGRFRRPRTGAAPSI